LYGLYISIKLSIIYNYQNSSYNRKFFNFIYDIKVENKLSSLIDAIHLNTCV